MEKSTSKLLILLSFLPLVVYPISIYGSLAFALALLLIVILVYKDAFVIEKVVQHSMILAVIILVRSAFSFVLQIFDYLVKVFSTCPTCKFSAFLLGFDNMLNAILLIALLAFTILAIVCFALKKELPLFGWLTKKVLSTDGVRKATNNQENIEDNE